MPPPQPPQPCEGPFLPPCFLTENSCAPFISALEPEKLLHSLFICIADFELGIKNPFVGNSPHFGVVVFASGLVLAHCTCGMCVIMHTPSSAAWVQLDTFKFWVYFPSWRPVSSWWVKGTLYHTCLCSQRYIFFEACVVCRAKSGLHLESKSLFWRRSCWPLPCLSSIITATWDMTSSQIVWKGWFEKVWKNCTSSQALMKRQEGLC